MRSRTAHTAENVILLVTLCSVRKVHHRHINQYLKFQGILEFAGRHLVKSSHGLYRDIYLEENNVRAYSVFNVFSGSVATQVR